MPEQEVSDCSESALGSTYDSLTATVVEQVINIDSVVTALVHTLAAILSCLTQSRVNSTKSTVRPGVDAFTNRVTDVIR